MVTGQKGEMAKNFTSYTFLKFSKATSVYIIFDGQKTVRKLKNRLAFNTMLSITYTTVSHPFLPVTHGTVLRTVSLLSTYPRLPPARLTTPQRPRGEECRLPRSPETGIT